MATTELVESSASLPSLSKSTSTASAGRVSLRSHVSIPVTGSLAYGTLQLVQPADDSPAETTSLPQLDPLDAGDIFLILGLPDAFTVGCDTAVLSQSGRPFLGVRDLPPGAHFLWLASSPASPSSSTVPDRSGYWFITGEGRGRLRVKQWDPYNELVGEPASAFEVRDRRDNLSAHLSSLTSYRDRARHLPRPPPPPPKDHPRLRPMSWQPPPELDPDATALWHAVTGEISEGLLRRVTGKQTAEWFVHANDPARGHGGGSGGGPSNAGVAPAEQHILLRAVAGAELAFTFPRDAPDPPRLPSPQRRPDPQPCVPDSTLDILAVLNFAGISEADVVGELQFAFVTGTRLASAACLDQWWHLLLSVLLRAHALALARPRLCRAWIAAVHAQLLYSARCLDGDGDGDGDGDEKPLGPAGVLDSRPAQRAQLREALTLYKRRLNEALLGLGDSITAEQAAVGHAFKKLEAWFWRYGWDLRSDYVSERVDAGSLAIHAAADRAGAREDGLHVPVILKLAPSSA
jgi:A1 cistron-splicing factor AAR2